MSLSKVLDALHKDPQPARMLAALCLKRTGLSHWLRIKHPDFVLRFYPTALSTAMFIDPQCRRADHDFFHAYLRKEDVVIDIGANVGTLALTASACVGERGAVMAFEPHPQTFKILLENIRLNRRSNIQCFNVALGERESVGRLSSSRVSDDQNAMSVSGEGLHVPVRDLDSFLREERPVALLKIDVEGYEQPVLLGAGDTLKRTQCIYFESSEAYFTKYGYSCSDVFRLLRERGFSIYHRRERTIRPIPAGYVSREHEDLIAVKDPAAFIRRTGFQIGDV